MKEGNKGEVNVEFEDWLLRRLVCTSEEPRDLATLSLAIINGDGQCTRICALRSYKYILTYPSKTLMEEALNNHEELDYWFHDIQRWTRYDPCEEPKVWLEVVGVPPRRWCWENFPSRLISLAKSITHTDTFESMKMLVITDHFLQIEEEILLTIDGEGNRVMLREIEPTIPQYFTSHSKRKVAHESNDGPPWFEDIEEDVAEDYCCSRQIDASPRRLVEVEANQESSEKEPASNLNCKGQQTQHKGSTSSYARTRTASASHNEYLKEALEDRDYSNNLDGNLEPPPGYGKIHNKKTVQPLEIALAHQESEDVEQQPPDFEKEVINEANNLDINTPHAIEFGENPVKEAEIRIHQILTSSEPKKPPGFELTNIPTQRNLNEKMRQDRKENTQKSSRRRLS
ncbi:hypothetical protein Cgig2_002653 [Carnegiea gigantea]|uniref:DUF4283 domain-containing protein n=1 Tax=Carnegiea gigantea TaxID=171969 RepID=A0A9Q1JGM6_9CARY|nr:hypothetical protein Cgig2_002653 [Carnegiea gigantea]